MGRHGTLCRYFRRAAGSSRRWSFPPFGNYELIQKVGAGGMGIIYKAKQIDLDRIVAMKMVVGHGHDRERFRMEAEAAGALRHPNIVSIHEVGEHRGRLFLTMPLIEGCDLKEHIESNEVSPKQAAAIAEQLARAVHYAHQRGILHPRSETGQRTDGR